MQKGRETICGHDALRQFCSGKTVCLRALVVHIGLIILLMSCLPGDELHNFFVLPDKNII